MNPSIVIGGDNDFVNAKKAGKILPEYANTGIGRIAGKMEASKIKSSDALSPAVDVAIRLVNANLNGKKICAFNCKNGSACCWRRAIRSGH